jgi:hypothetical protein
MMKEEVVKVNFYSNVLMILTSIHHIYGAVHYDTPWRLHVLLLSIPMIIFSVITSRFLVQENVNWKKLLAGFYAAIILIFSIILIGGYEGVYNHALKNVLFFSGMSEANLNEMFPPPKYVMPNDFLFESTGVAQATIWVPLLLAFLRLLRKANVAEPLKRSA